MGGAFVYEGKEYYDTTLGYGPLPWAVAAITLISFGAQLLKTVKKYQPPPPITPFIETDVGAYKNTSERAANIEFPWDRRRQNAIKAAAAKNGTGSQRLGKRWERFVRTNRSCLQLHFQAVSLASFVPYRVLLFAASRRVAFRCLGHQEIPSCAASQRRR